MPQDPVRAAFHRGLSQVAGLGGDLVGHANRIGGILWSPPRVVVVGRIKAGKSTLVNALIGAPVAETAALEATNVVTIYENGAPARAEVVTLDGNRAPIGVDPTRPVQLSQNPEEIAYVHRYLPSRAIQHLTLIDTPGLATLSNNAKATRRFLIDGFAQTRSASADADAVVFLFDSTPRADEVAFLRELEFTPLNTLGVLSRADSFGEGVLSRWRDPLEHAAEHAGALAKQLSDSVFAVLPVAGLLAETSHTGQVTESDARALHSLAGYEPLDLFDILESDRPTAIPGDVRDRLLDLVGEYGLVCGRSIAGQGAYALNSWLSERSGIQALQHTLYTVLHRFAAMHRCERIMVELDSLVYNHPARDYLRGIVHAIRADPAMEPVLLYRSLRSLLSADPHSPLIADLRLLLAGTSDAERMGLPTSASPADVVAAVNARLGWVQQRALATTSAAEDAAVAQLIGIYGRMRRG
ncbi:MAG: GTPase [Mycobacteriaceae bacterium]|nr:GTPase [Mycobacteriaceae bacterium]